LLRLSNLDAFADKTFETFDPKVPGVAQAYQAALRYAENPEGWLFLTGPCGVGKTHLAAAIAHRALDNRLTTFFTVVPDLLDHLRATFSPASDISYDELFEKVRAVPLLILDDLGTENATPWAVEKLYQLINHRYNYRFPTVITSNQDLDRMDRRIVSRLLDVRLVHHVLIDAEDYRQGGPGKSNRSRNRRR
jgi:DNA replication protein DnaC